MTVTYEQFEKLSKKYKITNRSAEKVIKDKFIKACYELSNLDSELMHSRIIDNFFENGERVYNIVKNAIKEEKQRSSLFQFIVEKYFK